MEPRTCKMILMMMLSMAPVVTPVVNPTIVTSQYKTYGSSVYAGDTNTCTSSSTLASEDLRGSDSFSSCLATCSHHSDCASFWLSSSSCLMVNTTKCSDSGSMRPAASNMTYYLKIIL